MNTIPITIHRRDTSYPIAIGAGTIGSLRSIVDSTTYSKIAIITDTIVAPSWLPAVKQAVGRETSDILVDSGELHKNIDTVQKIWKQMLENKLDRRSLVINLGGGVIGDMGGFAAATYMRGIDFVQIPTTLLAMVDASVGGKLGVDYEGYKNLIGSFAQPVAVVIDVTTLESLPDNQFIAGFAEIIKHGLIADKSYFNLVTAKKPRAFSTEELIAIISRSCSIKADVVQTDEQESGLRKILNFGHTVGHAVESMSLTTDTPLLHGEAIAIGMVAEASLSHLVGYITEHDVESIRAALVAAGLPTTYKASSIHTIQELMMRDKKNAKGILKWTLLKQIGEATYDCEVGADHITSALKTIRI